ncbi:MAG: cytochrome C oxidase subunit IV family protein [bacterium]|nr:cytochrome C oxidase subunit IV family protein [bacterium]
MKVTDSMTAKHHPHVLPLGTYLIIGSLLLALTAITVYISLFDFGSMNLIVAMAVAATKATLVALYFMHLKYDKKIFSIVFVGALIFLAIFIIFTMLDTLRRDDINPIRIKTISPNAVIYQDKPVADSTDTAGQSGVTDSLTVDSAVTDQSSH